MAVGRWQLATADDNGTATKNDIRQRLMADERYNNPEIKNYKDVAAWQKARALVKRIYGATKLFPKEELYGLTQQVRRAAVSVPSNIAEGYGRGSLGDYIRFLQVARGSLFELETQIILANDLEYLTEEQTISLTEDIEQCAKILQGLIASLKRKQ